MEMVTQIIWGNLVSHGEISYISTPVSDLDDTTAIIMQFTGLADKNGKDIYEGDILLDINPLNPGKMHKVFSVDGGFVISSHPNDFKKDPKSIYVYESTADMQTAGFIKGRCEVIGNIYETPELLNA